MHKNQTLCARAQNVHVTRQSEEGKLPSMKATTPIHNGIPFQSYIKDQMLHHKESFATETTSKNTYLPRAQVTVQSIADAAL